MLSLCCDVTRIPNKHKAFLTIFFPLTRKKIMIHWCLIKLPHILPPSFLLLVHVLKCPILLSSSTLSWVPCLLFILTFFYFIFFLPLLSLHVKKKIMCKKKKNFENVILAITLLACNTQLDCIQLLLFIK
jgi:hypothetical protein